MRLFEQLWKSNSFLRPTHTYGVGSSNDGAASLQRCDNASLGDGDALLLHGFMDAGPVLISHLKKDKGIHLSKQLSP